ncbi:MAG: hypothetical protein CVV49_18465 [Spirochaetae bacterium HGW-Spirochaetae-5]|nr:MAG: hypothetical protein CVV49_18465 [Spirochaetae bacterium HGW-Spirochaetae-5]
MKKIRTIFPAILIVITAALTWATVSYNLYSPGEINFTPVESDLKYFSESFDESRSLFRKDSAELVKQYKKASRSSFPVPSKSDNDLTVDILYLPSQKKPEKLIIISSGVHGVEGYTGSAVQRMIMEEFITAETLASTGFLFIHSMNPYGFRYNRRVTENNIDMNRNSSADSGLYKTVNEGYPAVSDLINPEGPVNTGSAGNIFFEIRSVLKIIRASMPVLRQAILQGQYQFPKGVYYGGSEPEPQIKSIAPYIKKYSAGYPIVMIIDLHTGYGERGKLHLFPNPVKDLKIRTMMEGDFTSYVENLLNGVTFIPMAFEYGTLDSQTTVGSIKSLHITLLENQGFNYGYKSDKDKSEVQKNFREMYFPSSPAWRTKVISDSRAIMKDVLKRFGEI